MSLLRRVGIDGTGVSSRVRIRRVCSGSAHNAGAPTQRHAVVTDGQARVHERYMRTRRHFSCLGIYLDGHCRNETMSLSRALVHQSLALARDPRCSSAHKPCRPCPFMHCTHCNAPRRRWQQSTRGLARTRRLPMPGSFARYPQAPFPSPWTCRATKLSVISKEASSDE